MLRSGFIKISFLLFSLSLILILTGCTKQKAAEEMRLADQPQKQPRLMEQQTENASQAEDFNIEFINISSFEVDLTNIRGWEGKSHNEYHVYFKELISKVFKNHKDLFFENTKSSTKFRKFKDNNNEFLIFKGNARHKALAENGLLSIGLNNGSITGAIRSDKKIFIYSTEQSINSIPSAVKDEINIWKSGKYNTQFIKINSFELDINKLSEYEGKYSFNLIKQADYKELISKIFGNDVSLFNKNMQASSAFKIVQESDNKILFTSGNAIHEGTLENALLSFNLSNGSVTGGILSYKKITIYSTEANIESIPSIVKEQIKDWENE